jgi:hypothetical protein
VAREKDDTKIHEKGIMAPKRDRGANIRKVLYSAPKCTPQ